MSELRELCEQYDVWYPPDNSFQRRARLRQAIWRDQHAYPSGKRNDRSKKELTWGCRLEMPGAEDGLWNFLTSTIGNRVSKELAENAKSQDPQFQKLLSTPRIYDDLLSSQPLCFNLFAELDADRDLASAVFRRLYPERVDGVDQIEFEYSPGRGNSKYLGNRSAFDVFVRYRTPTGCHGFAGIEVKYHENMRVRRAKHKERYDEVAGRAGSFGAPGRAELRKPPLQQIWLDHLLALSMLQAGDGWNDGFFVIVAPTQNDRCRKVADDYKQLLKSDDATFQLVDLEHVVDAIAAETNKQWIKDFRSRYLDFTKIPDH